MAKQNFDNDELTAYYSNIYAELEKNTLNDPYGNYVLSRVKGGQKTVFNKAQTEVRNFDMSFLDTIESVYPAILKIMRDPKKSIRYDEEVVAVEKARKINAQTVRHLSSHTQFIKEITPEGDVRPSKVLTTFAEEEIAIYENRFIKSLVKRMEMFLERRYDVMKLSLESFETNRLNVNNEFLMSGQKVIVNLDIQIKNDLTANIEATKAQYKRLLYVREMVQGLKGTEFMRALAKARDVLPPIMKTNIILKNPDFKLCYGLWLYLDQVDTLSTNIDVREKSYRYSNVFDKDINQCMSLALTAFLKNREIEGIYSSKNLGNIKPPKVQKNEDLELELNFNADNQKLEDYRMNQVLLNETAKFFEASLSGMERTGNKFNESIRVVYRQMLDMLDQIYPKAFGIADDELDKKDLYQQLEYARRQKMIFNIVRQQKQMNIARMGKEEKRIEKLITSIDTKIKAAEEKERLRLEKEAQIAEAKRLAEEEAKRQAAERRKRLEKEALDRQRAVEKKANSKVKSKDRTEGTLKANKQRDKIKDFAIQSRDRLRDAKLAKLKAIEDARIAAEEAARKAAEEEAARIAAEKEAARIAKEKEEAEIKAYEDALLAKDPKTLTKEEKEEVARIKNKERAQSYAFVDENGNPLPDDYIPTDEELEMMAQFLEDTDANRPIPKLNNDVSKEKTSAPVKEEPVNSSKTEVDVAPKESKNTAKSSKKTNVKPEQAPQNETSKEPTEQNIFEKLNNMPADYIPTDEELAEMEEFLANNPDPEEVPKITSPAYTNNNEAQPKEPTEDIPSDEELAQMEEFLANNPDPDAVAEKEPPKTSKNKKAKVAASEVVAEPVKETKTGTTENDHQEDDIPSDEELAQMEEFLANNPDPDVKPEPVNTVEPTTPIINPNADPTDEELAEMEAYLNSIPEGESKFSDGDTTLANADDQVEKTVYVDENGNPLPDDYIPTDEELAQMEEYLANNPEPDANAGSEDTTSSDNSTNAPAEKTVYVDENGNPLPDDYVPTDEELAQMEEYLANNPEPSDVDVTNGSEDNSASDAVFVDENGNPLPDDYIPTDEELAQMEEFLANNPDPEQESNDENESNKKKHTGEENN